MFYLIEFILQGKKGKGKEKKKKTSKKALKQKQKKKKRKKSTMAVNHRLGSLSSCLTDMNVHEQTYRHKHTDNPSILWGLDTLEREATLSKNSFSCQ